MIVILILQSCDGRNPEHDAKEVCNCYREQVKSAKIITSTNEFLKCVILNGKMSADYQDNSEKSKLFKKLSFDCVAG